MYLAYNFSKLRHMLLLSASSAAVFGVRVEVLPNTKCCIFRAKREAWNFTRPPRRLFASAFPPSKIPLV